jgi:hypothetical protein
MRIFSNWIQGYLDWTSASESPTQFHLWTAIGTVAGALRSCVWIEEFGYTITPNLFLFIVGPAGVAAKSTSISNGMRLLEQIPSPNKITFGPSSLSWQYLLRVFNDSIITVRWVDDNMNLHQRAASPVIVEASELGTFLKLSQDGLMEQLINLWDGKISARGVSHGTISSGNITVQNPWLHIVGATTPAWLSVNIPENMIGGGLVSRILFIYGDYKRQLVAFPSRKLKSLQIDVTKLEKDLVADLTEIASLRGPMRLTEDAYKWGEKWYENLWLRAPPHLTTERLQGYRSRKQIMLLKVATVLSAATREDRVIDEAIMISADLHLTQAEEAMLKVFNSIGIVEEARQSNELVSVVRSYASLYPEGMTSSELYKLVSNTITARDFETAVKQGIVSGVLIKASRKEPNGQTVLTIKLGKT